MLTTAASEVVEPKSSRIQCCTKNNSIQVHFQDILSRTALQKSGKVIKEMYLDTGKKCIYILERNVSRFMEDMYLDTWKKCI